MESMEHGEQHEEHGEHGESMEHGAWSIRDVVGKRKDNITVVDATFPKHEPKSSSLESSILSRYSVHMYGVTHPEVCIVYMSTRRVLHLSGQTTHSLLSLYDLRYGIRYTVHGTPYSVLRNYADQVRKAR